MGCADGHPDRRPSRQPRYPARYDGGRIKMDGCPDFAEIVIPDVQCCSQCLKSSTYGIAPVGESLAANRIPSRATVMSLRDRDVVTWA